MQVYAPLPGYQEPELYIEEVFPSWIIKASRADGYIRIGLFADIWADILVIDARNPLIYPGAPGHVDASQGIHVLEVPTGPVDRSRGEIHLQGNPHYLLDPLNAKIVADSILRALVAMSSEEADFFTANTEDFKRRIDEAMGRWQEMGRALAGQETGGVSPHLDLPVATFRPGYRGLCGAQARHCAVAAGNPQSGQSDGGGTTFA